MRSTGIAAVSYRSNRGNLRVIGTTDIPGREPSQASTKRRCPMRQPQAAKARPLEFRAGIAEAILRFWIRYASGACFFSRGLWLRRPHVRMHLCCVGTVPVRLRQKDSSQVSDIPEHAKVIQAIAAGCYGAESAVERRAHACSSPGNPNLSHCGSRGKTRTWMPLPPNVSTIFMVSP
jgi:hypothetical protein